MKKIILFLLFILAGNFIYATDLTGVKIYVNPGHGGYDSDDRNVLTIPFNLGDTLGFYESKSNLMKGLYLRDLLLSQNATVMISRTQNRTQDDRALSDIVAEANAFEPDGFLSIHSNANGSADNSTNYLLFLYSGTDAASITPGTKEYATACWPFMIDNQLTSWSSTTVRIRGDCDFYHAACPYLGVLRGLVYKAFLSEGSFHDYKPETHRLLNRDYCNLEAYRYFQFFHSFFNADMPNTGTIGGWVKSENEKMSHPRYKYRTGSPDQWRPLNGAKVMLFDASGNTELQSYTTDTLYNGIFAFYNLTPGNYKLKFEATDYITDTVVDITVEAGKIAYAKVQLYNENVPVPRDYVADYPNPTQSAGVVALNNYNFTQVNNTQPAWLTDATNIKRVIHRNDKLYVLTTEPKIYVYNASSYSLIKELSLTGISGGTHSIISDIAFTADNYLLACNKEDIALPETGGRYFKVYTWDNDDANPTLLFETQNQANWGTGTVGETFTASGPRWNVRVYTTSVTTSASKQIRVIGLEYLDTVYPVQGLGYKYMMDATNYTEALWGTHPIFTISPSGDRDHIYLDSDILLPSEYQFDWSKPDRDPLTLKGVFTEQSGYTINNSARGSIYFRHAQHTYFAAPVCETSTANVGFVLFDVTSGLDNAVKISEKYPNPGLGATAATYMTAGAKVDNYDIEIIILAKNQGIARYRTTPLPVKANIYASELSITADQKFQFTLNENAESVDIKFYDENFVLAASHTTGALPKGVNIVEYDFANALPNGSYTWAVTAKAGSVDRPALISDNSAPFQFYSPRGVAIDNSFDSPFFGRIYVSESWGGPVAGGRTTQNGIYILNAAFADTTNQQNTSYAGGVGWLDPVESGYQYGPLRLHVAPDGKVYIPDSHYANSGVWIMDPANPSAAFTSVFGGTRNTATGEVTNGGTTIHHPVQSAYVLGSGAGTQLFIMDRVNSPVSATINRYDIGDLSALPWTAAPSEILSLGSYFQNGYGTIEYDGNGGWFASQYRSDGNSGASVPPLVHRNSAGVIDYNSANDSEILEDGTSELKVPGSNRGGMAVSPDGNLLAIGTKVGIARVFEINYGAEGVSNLILKHELVTGTSAQTHDAAFDVAGNLYLVDNVTERLKVFTLPKVDNSFTTPAPANSIVVVNNILVDEANIYASELNLSTADSVEFTFKYTLNAKASSLVIHILDSNDQTIKDIPVTAAADRTRGVHQFTTSITGLQAGTYKWSITATGAMRSNSATEPTKVSNDDTQFLFWGPRDVAVDNSFESPFFGRIYATESAHGTVAVGNPNPTRTTTRGIYILNSAFSDTTQQGSTAYAGGIDWSDNIGRLYRVSVAPDGKVYMADNSVAHAGIWIMNPANPSENFTAVFTPGIGNLSVHGRIAHCRVIDTGVNAKLFTFDAGNYSYSGNINRYDIGTATLPWTTAPSAVVYDDNLNGNLQQNYNSCIVPDTSGGWWISQSRVTNNTAIPSLMHAASTGVVTNFGSHPDITSSYEGGLAISADNTLLAIGTTIGSLKVFDINFDVSGIPSLTLKYNIPIGSGGYNAGVAFDVANNVYSIDNATERLRVFALPKADNSFTTPAPSKSNIVITTVNKPVVESTTPANGATNVSTNLSSVSITFNQEMNTGVAGTVEIINTQTNAVTGSVSSPQWSADNKTVTLTYSGQLDYVTNYTIKISGFKSSSNAQMDENSNNSFTTTSQPVIISAIPANGATNVSINLNNVSITFSKKMNSLITGVAEIKLGASIIGSFTTPYWSPDDRTIILTFTGTLDYDTNYTLNIRDFVDETGAVMNDTVLNFTTEQKPLQKVTLFINKDLYPWIDHAKTFTLNQGGQVKFVGVDNLDGSVTFEDVEDGLYRLYDGENEVQDQVIYGTTGFGLSYFTVLYGLQNSGHATNSVINATYDGNTIAGGDVVLGGKKLILQAQGNGANSYTYTWRGTWKGNKSVTIDGDMIVADVLDNIVNVHCTITGDLKDEIILPKVVTPNEDGKNDFFYIHGLETYPQNELRIFNRSGTEIFRAKNYRNNTWNGNNLPNDVYFFSISLIDANGAITTKTGYVHLNK
ncbi:MAG: gliding motility-associated C-terminal domain-containing protein [Prevotellaceae bacterium]|jgi:gliding motility-associated-like protein|nr:gliding motility-associated C-terminal domain-containing protein [Prevotellaceae bacterium]